MTNIFKQADFSANSDQRESLKESLLEMQKKRIDPKRLDDDELGNLSAAGATSESDTPKPTNGHAIILIG